MHSRKSIFSRGIIFIMSIFAFAIFASIKVGAVCEVGFEDGSQYLTIGGDQSKWNDSGLIVTGGDGDNCSSISVSSISINGTTEEGITLFTTSGKVAGHYTIGYNYSYLDGDSTVTGTINRYLRILNGSYDTSNNYTLATFDDYVSGETTIKLDSVIDSFYVGQNYFANFVHGTVFNVTGEVTGTATFLVVKDAWGRTINGGIKRLDYSTADIIAERVVKVDNIYYVIANTAENNGVVVSYGVTITASGVTISSATSASGTNVTYKSGYMYVNTTTLEETLYLVGQGKDGKARIDQLVSGTISNVHTHTIAGSYNGIYVSSDKTIYAVGYEKPANVSISVGLYTYIQSGGSAISLNNILGTTANTVFNDIIYDKINEKSIIVGESKIDSIMANNVLTATNTRQGYSDGIILQVSSDGTTITGAYMFGGNTEDTFKYIKETSEGSYVVVGEMDNGAASLVYTLDSAFNATADVTSASSDYKINGIAYVEDYGYAYYGELKANFVLGAYYPRTLSDSDALFISLDNRKFENYDAINLVVNTSAKYCDYKIKFAGVDIGSKECNASEDTVIDTANTGNSKLEYFFDSLSGVSGVKIYVYRVINITSAPKPTDLTSGKTGILRWYVYNRSYTTSNDNATRLSSSGFTYAFSGDKSSETIESMVESYFKTGSTEGYTLNYRSTATEDYKTFASSNQTNAAFASIEYAKKFAYYQEFSRIVRVDGSNTVNSLGAVRYTGQTIENGSSFFIYYIDFKGNDSTDLVNSCNITENSITNCSAKGGYAFANLNSIKNVIEMFLKYNNYFVSTRNTIYNGSIPVSEVAAYQENLYTKEYLTNAKFTNMNTSLTFNVTRESDNAIIYSGKGKDVYFGGSVNGTSYTHSQIQGTQTVSTMTGVEYGTYYESSNYIFLNENMCYKVYYSYVDEIGTERVFCLDTTAPTIEYIKDNQEEPTLQTVNNSEGGTSANKPLYIEDDFNISNLIDLDDYAFIYINGNRYPLTCSSNSESCKAERNKYIMQAFRYDADEPMRVRSITFSDRMLNTNMFYFIIGTTAPTIQKENETENGFTLVINFYNTNPITGFNTLVSQQVCSNDVSTNCYNPTKDDTTAIVNSLNSFNEALLNYIYAVGYRDNNKSSETILTIVANENVYTINGIDYVIEDGYFVEYGGYEESYGLTDNDFTYDGVKYNYNEIQGVIRPYFEDGTINTDADSEIIIVDNVFRFSEDGKEYTLVDQDGILQVVALPQKYEIYNDNLFTIGDIIYSIDYKNSIISYTNPEITTMKRIKLDFDRTISINNQLSGGVDIPNTQRVIVDGKEQFDALTGLPAYEIIEDYYTHYNLVDGVYIFTISHDFPDNTVTQEASINVNPIEMDLGYAVNHEGLEVVSGLKFNFGAVEDTDSALAVQSLTNDMRYPISAGIVPASNLDAYKDTYFVNKTVYVSYQVANTGVFTIKVYSAKNAYGLPSKASPMACDEIIIYGNAYESNPIENNGCNSSTAIKFENLSTNKDLLANLGIVNVFAGYGAFAFNGQNKFYNISLRTYEESNGDYVPTSEEIKETFYIDSLTPDYDDGVKGKTIVPYIYDNEGEVTDVNFEANGANYVLSTTVGSNTNVAFRINWYASGETVDYRENKLLLLKIVDGENTTTCNVYQLINTSTYETECKKYVDLDSSTSGTEESLLVFSATGAYQIEFIDASGNGNGYSFSIDKTAPDANLVEVKMDANGMENIISTEYVSDRNSYYVLAYTKNPTFSIKLEDLSAVSQYCYYFDYGQASDIYHECISGATTEYSFRMDEYRINKDSLVSIDTYFAQNSSDQNVILYVWAVDEHANGSVADATKIYFWVDYKSPSTTVTKQNNLNTTKISIEEIDDNSLADKTITVLSSEYSGKKVLCDSEKGFSFIDPRYTSTVAPYEFVVSCEDTHTAGSNDYPNEKSFINNVYMKFYESDGTTKLVDEFNFGIPTTGDARWIYITTVDIVGNESDQYVILPIFVQDSVAPRVEVATKELKDENGVGTGTFVELAPTSYTYPNGTLSVVYLANSTIRVQFSEPIAKMKNCLVAVVDKDGNSKYLGSCDDETYGDSYSNGTTYKYTDLQTTFEFANSLIDTYKVVVFEVEDYAGWPSGNIVVVIDNIAPTIGFNEGQEEDDVIEYITSSKTYDDNYITNGYLDHIYARDDQGADLKINIKYTIYSPSITYNNYKMENNKYVAVPNGETRKANVKYYVLVNANLVVNKKCVSTMDIDGTSYCFVQDNQSSYYFDSLLEDETGNVWKDTISQIDSKKIGVYRISYSVVDYAGNESNVIYKKVFVNDSINPDVDIYDTTVTEKLYGNLTSSNIDNFEGKLNKSVAFVGTDSAENTNTRIVLYKCDISDYKDGKCIIDQPLFSSVKASESGSNIYNIGSRLTDGVYKVFVYDYGMYTNVDSSGVYYSTGNLDTIEKVYSLTHNASYFYFAISVNTIDANYVINGNKYTSGYSDGSSYKTYNYSETNYYTITNGSKASDVYLLRYDVASGTYKDVSGINAIGYSGGKVEFTQNNGTVTVTYKDSLGRVIYEVKYLEYTGELLLHETYHNVDLSKQTVEVCKMVNGQNTCKDLPIVYQVISVTANVYEDGNYLLQMVDRYGNLSQEVEELVVDNTAYVENKNNNKPTGINYWYSVPSKAIGPSDSKYFVNLLTVDNESGINVLDDIYTGNFNSEFFYAFSSKAEAKAYLTSVYTKEIERQLATGAGYTFYGLDGNAIRTYTTETASQIALSISNTLSEFIFTTYTQNRNFSDSAMRQIAYTENTSSSMYQYTYLLVTTVYNASGSVSHTYRLAGNTCEAGENQKCIKVDLKIISATNTSINVVIDPTVNNIICRISGTGGSGELSGSACNFNAVASGGTYVFIDSDISKYHENVVYYGVTAYSEAADVNYYDIGDYIPLEKFAKYTHEGGNSYVEKQEGEYIWLNSEFVLITAIKNTNLYAKTCNFLGGEYTGCVYVTYLSRYNRTYTGSEYKNIPSPTGAYYYNYYDDTYYDSKSAVMSALGVDCTFDNGRRCEGGNCNSVPIKINSHTIKTDLSQQEITIPTNKKTYVELFNETTVNRIFEINAISVEGTYQEVYSYAILTINGAYHNINKYIIIDDDKLGYRCIIDIELENSYAIVITDRAGNQLFITISHSDETPVITYAKQTEDITNSNVEIAISTESTIANITKGNTKIYKYNFTTGVYASEEYKNATCLSYSIEDDIAYTKRLLISFKYTSEYDCSGLYKVEIKDTHGNSNYKEFVFNPYRADTSYELLGENPNVYQYSENEIIGAIVNTGFKVSVNADLNYLIINRYKPYSNAIELNLNNLLERLQIKDFTQSYSLGTDSICNVEIIKEGNYYSINISGSSANHNCDGVYSIDVVNRFSETIINSSFANLEGANQELISYKAIYAANNSATIEIDTLSPDIDFGIEVDKTISEADAARLKENKSISYTNKYITVTWGNTKESSFAYLKYRVGTTNNWVFVTDAKYDGEYTSSYEFKVTQQGVYNCEFMFVDAVGNEDASKVYTIVITIEPPEVGFFEVNGYDNKGNIIIGDKYGQEARIADETILRCSKLIDPENSQAYSWQPCSLQDYNYQMLVNGADYTTYFTENDIELQDTIRKDSPWFILGNPNHSEVEELVIRLLVTVKGKEDIRTELSIIIDNKAPRIDISGTPKGSTYVGGVTITIQKDISTDYAVIYKCETIENDTCKKYDSKGNLVDGGSIVAEIVGENNTAIISTDYSGYFFVESSDVLGNKSSEWFVLDNEAPVIKAETENTVIAPNMYTNASAVYLSVNDTLSSIGSSMRIQFEPADGVQEIKEITYDPTMGLTEAGKYTIVPIDGVGNEGREITFRIWRQMPFYMVLNDDIFDFDNPNIDEGLKLIASYFATYLSGKGLNLQNMVMKDFYLLLPDLKSDASNARIAPIVSVTVDGKLYNVTYDEELKAYKGPKVSNIGEHTIVVTDAAGNQSVTMVTVNNTKKVCINGNAIEVKMQGYYNVDALLIGKEAGVKYAKDDVFIFALPSQASSGDCVEQGLLGYRTLDPKASYYHIANDANARAFNENQYDFVKHGFISQNAINEIKGIGGSVVVFVVTKDVANDQLGYTVGTNFFLQDPIGWCMIFASCASLVWPACRIFIKKKVRVI